MNKNSSSFVFTLLYELYCIIKYAFNVFNSMIFQMILFVFKGVFMIILTNISTTVYNVSDFIVKQSLFVLSYCLRSQKDKILNNFGAYQSEFAISCLYNTCVRLFKLIHFFVFWSSFISVFCIFHFLYLFQKYIHFEFRSFVFFFLLRNIFKNNWRHW